LKENNTHNCPFCSDEFDVIEESEHCFAIRDSYPVSKGHTLIISKRHISDFHDLNKNEQENCWALVNKIRNKLESELKPDGFNIGINVGKVAGQTVFHTHIHVIPRYEGDIENPRGGIRNVIPEMGDY
jgi:diadenosine tetraphosphate (Ap4A) HIT family hydrolase